MENTMTTQLPDFTPDAYPEWQEWIGGTDLRPGIFQTCLLGVIATRLLGPDWIDDWVASGSSGPAWIARQTGIDPHTIYALEDGFEGHELTALHPDVDAYELGRLIRSEVA